MNNLIDEEFNEVYDKTYHSTLKYIISKCDNLSNVEEIMQEVYIKLYNQIKKDSSYIKNYNQFLIKLAKNELFKYYSIKNKFKILLNVSLEEKMDFIENLKDENLKQMKNNLSEKVEAGTISKEEANTIINNRKNSMQNCDSSGSGLGLKNYNDSVYKKGVLEKGLKQKNCINN